MRVLSPIFNEISGSLGGAVGFMARGGIMSLRSKRTPKNPLSFLQLAVRNAAINLSALWLHTLTEPQTEAWWDLASGGQTGKALFTKTNQPRAYNQNVAGTNRYDVVLGDPVEDFKIYLDPPALLSYTGGLSPSYVIDDSANTLQLNFVAGQIAAFTDESHPNSPTVLLVYASHQQSASRFSRQHPMSLVAALNWTEAGDADPGPINLAALGYTTAVGKVMYIKCVLSTGDGAYAATGEDRIVITA